MVLCGKNVENVLFWKCVWPNMPALYTWHWEEQVWLTRSCRTGHRITSSRRPVVMTTCSSLDIGSSGLIWWMKEWWMGELQRKKKSDNSPLHHRFRIIVFLPVSHVLTLLMSIKAIRKTLCKRPVFRDFYHSPSPLLFASSHCLAMVLWYCCSCLWIARPVSRWQWSKVINKEQKANWAYGWWGGKNNAGIKSGLLCDFENLKVNVFGACGI